MALTRTVRRRPLAAAAAAALLAVALVVLVIGAPVAWFLLGVCAVTVAVVLVPGLREGRIFDPLVLIALFGAAAFVIRPLYLFLNTQDLASFRPVGAIDTALPLVSQDIANFVTLKLDEGLEPALTRAIAACALFLILLVVGYRLPVADRAAARLAALGSGTRSESLNVRAVVAVSLLLGLVAQVAIVAKTGGIAETLNTTLEQKALGAGLAYYALAGFGIAGVVSWAALARPRTRLAWAGLAAAVLEQVLFYAAIGTRTRAFIVILALVIVVHFLWRPLRVRWFLASIAVGIVVSAGLVGIRDETRTEQFPETLTGATRYLGDVDALLGDVTEYDQLLVATSTIGRSLDHRHGGWVVSAFHSYVPGFIDPDKPQSGDIEFREAVFGDELSAGRPISAIGDFYYDFGWPGIAVGSLLLGLLLRALTGLTAGGAAGRGYRVALYALVLVTLYLGVFNTYTVGLGYVATLVVPFLIAIHVFGRLPAAAPTSTRVRRAKAPVRS